MALERQAATIVATPNSLKTEPGPRVTKYAVVLSQNALWKWVPDDTSTENSASSFPTCVNPAAAGGYAGRWLRVAAAVKGANLTDAAVDIAIADGRHRVLPAATLGANRIATLTPDGAVAGDTFRLTRLDAGAYTYAIVDEASAATLTTLPVSQRWFAEFAFDGTNWFLTAAGQMP